MSTHDVRHTYRLRPSRGARAALEAEWDRCRWVWNELVARSMEHHLFNEIALANGARRDDLPTFGYAAQDRHLTAMRAQHGWLREGSSVAQQQTVRDFAAARSRALAGRKAHKPATQRAGDPRFKRRDEARPTMNYTVRGFSLIEVDGQTRLRLAGGIVIPVVWSRELPSQPRSVRVSRDALGHWYASFVVTIASEPLPVPDGAEPIGIDWGVRNVAVMTEDAHDLSHAQHRKRAQQRLARYQRMMARRRRPRGQEPSRGYRTARTKVARAHAKVARQRQDDTRKWAKNLVREHDRIAVEDFRPKFMAANRSLSAKAADAAIGSAKSALVWMATKHERDLRLVNPAYTGMDCSECGARTKHRLPLSERTYTCLSCGCVKDRDKNAAAAMVVRAGFVPEDVEGVRPDGPVAVHPAA